MPVAWRTFTIQISENTQQFAGSLQALLHFSTSVTTNTTLVSDTALV